MNNKKRELKTIIEEKEIKLELHKLNLTLDYGEVGTLIDLLRKESELRDLRKELMGWYGKIK